MKAFKFVSQIVVVIFASFFLLGCNQDDDVIIQTELVTVENTVNSESVIDSEVQEFLRNHVAEQENITRNLFDPSVLEIGVRFGTQRSFRRVTTNPVSCINPSTNYQILLAVPASGPQAKACVCLTINRNGAAGTSSPRQCRDTRTVTVGQTSFNYFIYNVMTSSSGTLNYTAQAGCGGNTPISSFSTLPSGTISLGGGISTFPVCL